jgi:hypothetical protein
MAVGSCAVHHTARFAELRDVYDGACGLHLVPSLHDVKALGNSLAMACVGLLETAQHSRQLVAASCASYMVWCGAENMRREGFELSVSPPRVVYREEGGQKLEPIEEVICEVEDAHAGSVIEVRWCRGPATSGRPAQLSQVIDTNVTAYGVPEFLPGDHTDSLASGRRVQALSLRKGDLQEMVPLEVGGKQRLVFQAPSRGLIGFRSAFATLTRGTGILHRAFSCYGPFRGPLDGVRKGVIISVAGASLPPECTVHTASPCRQAGFHSKVLRCWAADEKALRRAADGCCGCSRRWQDYSACPRQS